MSEDTTRLLPNDDSKLILAQLQIVIGRLDTIDANQRALEARQAALEERQASLEERQVALEQRQASLEEKVERRLQETRPIWEAVLAQLQRLELRMDRFEASMTALESEQKEIRRGLFYNSREFTRMNDELLERIEKLEGRDAA